jgi:hypothetical protein
MDELVDGHDELDIDAHDVLLTQFVDAHVEK